MNKIEKIYKDKNNIKILAIADFHIGSTTAILHPKAVSYDGEIFSQQPQNEMQRWLWKNYLNDITTIGKTDIMISLGDLVEGLQLKIGGRTLVDADVESQIRWAVEILQTAIDLAKPEYFIGVSGTAYHVRNAGTLSADFEVYNLLQKQNPKIQFIIGDNLIVKIGKLIYSIAHPYPITEYTVPPMEKLITQHAREYYLENVPKINVFLRGHCHVYNYLNYRGQGTYVITVPCQQPTSAYGRERAYLTVRRPDVGVLELQQIEDTIIPKPYIHKWKK